MCVVSTSSVVEVGCVGVLVCKICGLQQEVCKVISLAKQMVNSHVY